MAMICSDGDDDDGDGDGDGDDGDSDGRGLNHKVTCSQFDRQPSQALLQLQTPCPAH